MFNRRHSIYAGWVALFALLFGAIAPSVSYALAAESGKNVIEICTSFGARKIELDSKNGSTSHDFLQSQHCPFCVLQHHPFAPFASASITLSVSICEYFLNLGYAAVFFPHRNWPSAHSRAPPV